MRTKHSLAVAASPERLKNETKNKSHHTIAHLVFPNAKMPKLKKPKELFSKPTE